jgi:nicotinic acid mononucleotide adenylyltransferase/nicotinamide mononucleotide (NMN) deamidase PncC
MNPPESIARMIAQLYTKPITFVLEFAGAGSLALFWLHSVPGSSRAILEATDRYASESLTDLLGRRPESFVSDQTAQAMAVQAYRRARRLSDHTQCIGVALTATIATDRTKRGKHNCRIAVHDHQGVRTFGLTLAKGRRTRTEEEQIVSRLLLHAIATAYGVDIPVPIDLLADEQIVMAYTAQPDPIAQLLDQHIQSVTVTPDGRRTADAPVQGALLSGSFNPLHAGHEQLLYAAERFLQLPAAFELPVFNADKPPLHYAEIERRLAQFQRRYSVTLSRAPLFRQKAELFPGCVFVIGYDTAVRLIKPVYYGGEHERDSALEFIRAQGCRFLVAGRVQGEVFQTLETASVPPAFDDLFIALPERMFRVDLSSTEIRARMRAQGTGHRAQG